jgi:hypothetical protein
MHGRGNREKRPVQGWAWTVAEAFRRRGSHSRPSSPPPLSSGAFKSGGEIILNPQLAMLAGAPRRRSPGPALS